MKSTPIDYDQADYEPSGYDEAGSITLTALEMPDDAESDAAAWSGPRCEKCEAPLKSDVVTICRRCGWYSSLGTFVEIDANWETDDEAEGETAPRPQPSHAQVWFELVPWWGWVIIASVFAIVVESVVARLVTPAGSSLRTTWSLAQLAIGLLAVLGGHAFNFLVQAAEDADVGVLDLVLRPVKLWQRTFRWLPKRLWCTDVAASGLVAVVMSIVVIGGIPYDRLWDWGFTPPPKQALMGAVMDRMKQIEDKGADNLEDAVGDFAGRGELDENGMPLGMTPPAPRHNADCVILGYQLDKDGRLSALVLGTAHLGRLVYAGNIAPKFATDVEASEMLARLFASRTNQRLLPVEIEAVWVKPTITCRVTYDKKQRDGRLSDLKWDTVLGTMKTK